MNILVTGGAGYVGSVLVPALLHAGHAVHVLDNFMYGQGAALAACCGYSKFVVTRGDARDQGTLRPLVAWAEIVLPLAAIVGAPACEADSNAAVTTNTGAIRTLINLMSADQCLIIPITNSGYGIGSNAECTEESPLRPVSLYGRTKVAGEKVALSRENSISFRLATVFGMSPRMRVDLMVNDFVYRAVNDRALVLFEAHFRRNFVHVRDVAKAFLHAIYHFDEMKGRAYNVGLDEANMTKWQLCERIKAHVPGFTFLEASVGEDPDKRDYLVSNERIKATGWRAQWSLDDGIIELIKGYTMLRDRQYGNA